MLGRDQIRRLLHELEAELATAGAIGEVGILGGAVMCLVFDARVATRDVDAVFRPTSEIRAAASRVAKANGLPEDWLNDAAKGFLVSTPPRVSVLDLPHLRVWAPTAEYMLAMKCVSARYDTHDAEDVEFLIRELALRTPEEVFAVIARYYPKSLVPPKTRFLVEELLVTRDDEEARG